MNTPRSSIRDIQWPAIPSYVEGVLMSIQYQFEQTQWWSPERLLELQFEQLQRTLRHAQMTTPYYRRALQSVGFDVRQPLTMDAWSGLPLLTRDTLQDSGQELLSTSVDKQHGKTFEKSTSGSSGRRLRVTDTEANRLFWMAITLRDHLWHQRDFGGTLVSIRSGRKARDPQQVLESPSWGPSTGAIFNTGPSVVFYHLLPIEKQVELLVGRDPEYILAYPSNLTRLAGHFQKHHLALPKLKGLLTYGEPVIPEAHAICRDAFNVGIVDLYSCEELGYIALQCPETDNYHVQSETLLVEVLNEQNQPCRPGEIGRVVLSSLHNFAMPLLRYENGDFAEVGEACPCGRGLPTLKRIHGRARNMALSPTGERYWPQIPSRAWGDMDGVEEIQLVQKEMAQIELRIKGRPLGDDGEARLTARLNDALGHAYRYTIRYEDTTLRHDNGKYELFIQET